MKNTVNLGKAVCVYVTFNKPAKVLQKLFKSRGVNIDKILFVDTITRLFEDADLEKSIIYLDSPKKLTDVLIIIRNRLETSPDAEGRFVFIDSLSNIMTYNSLGDTIKFIQSLTNKLRLVEVGGKLLLMKGGEVQETTIEEFAKFADEIIEL